MPNGGWKNAVLRRIKVVFCRWNPEVYVRGGTRSSNEVLNRVNSLKTQGKRKVVRRTLWEAALEVKRAEPMINGNSR